MVQNAIGNTGLSVKVTVKKGLPSTFVIGEEYIQDEWGSYTVDKTKNLIVFDK